MDPDQPGLASEADPPTVRVLVVDDSPDDRAAYARFLGRAAHRRFLVTEVETGAEALAAVERERFDCVLLDYGLPDMDGIDVIEAGLAQTGVAVVVLTGQGTERVAVQALKSGAQDYVVKSDLDGPGLERAVLAAIADADARQRDLADRRRLESLAVEDPLTGLLNRRALFERAGVECERTRRYGDPLCVLMLDLDHFKRINDEHGHPAGDAVLRGVARAIEESTRVNDVAGRYGGEEFAVVLVSCDLGQAERFAERLRRRVEGLATALGPVSLPAVTCSIGVAECRGDEAPGIECALARADEALYRAKSLGRNRVVVAGRGRPPGRGKPLSAA